jgi:MFS family permease
MAFGLVAFLIFLSIGASNAVSPMYVVYQARYHFTALTLTEVYAVYAAGVTVALLAVGHLSDVIGRRRVLAPALVLLGLSAVLFASARGTGWLFAARAVQGLANGTITGAATAALVELEPTHDRQRASYINTVAFIMGAASGPLLFGVAIDDLPWPTVLPFAAEGALIAIGLIGVLRMPETRSPDRSRRWSVQRPSVPRPVLVPFVVAVLAVCVAWGVAGLFAALSPSIDRDLLHVDSHAAAGLVLFVFSGIGGLAQLILQRWPPRRSITVGTAATAVGMSFAYLGLQQTGLAIFVAGSLLAGAGSGLAFLGSLALVNHVAPPLRRAEVVSAWNLIGYVALSVPVIGVGLLTGVAGLRDSTGIFTAAVIALSAVTIVAVARSPREPLGRLSNDELAELGLSAPAPWSSAQPRV